MASTHDRSTRDSWRRRALVSRASRGAGASDASARPTAEAGGTGASHAAPGGVAAESVATSDEVEAARRGRALTAFVLFALMLCVAGAIAHGFDDSPRHSAWLVVAMVPLAGSLLVLRRWGRVDVATAWFCFWGTAASATVLANWTDTPIAFVGILAVPVVANACGGPRAGLGWTAIATLALAGIAATSVDDARAANGALAVAIVGVTLAISEAARERASDDQRRAEKATREIRVEREQAERELARSDSLFAAVFAGAPSTLSISVAETGEVLDVNERWSEVFGYARDEAIGSRLTDLGIWSGADRREFLLDRVLSGEVGEVDVWLRRRDGSEVFIRSSAVVLTLDGVRCLVCQGVEVTDGALATRARADSDAGRSSGVHA